MVEPSIGMMEGAYFVSKNDILSWLNSLLNLNLTKIEQLGSGAVYCQIIDAIFPGKVKMKQVKWQAKQEWEFLHNYKILQNAFTDAKLKRYVEVEKLSQARYLDNLEFAQWMKKLFDMNNGSGANYNAEERRGNVPTDFGFAEKNVQVKTFNPQGQASYQNTVEPTKVVKKPKAEKQQQEDQESGIKEKKEEKKQILCKKDPVQKQQPSTTTKKQPAPSTTTKSQPQSKNTTGAKQEKEKDSNKNNSSQINLELENQLTTMKQSNQIFQKYFQEIYAIIHSEIQLPQTQNEQQAQIQIANFKLDKINAIVSKILNASGNKQQAQQIKPVQQQKKQVLQNLLNQDEVEEVEENKKQEEEQQDDEREQNEDEQQQDEGEGDEQQQEGEGEEEQQQEEENQEENQNNNTSEKKYNKEDEDLI